MAHNHPAVIANIDDAYTYMMAGNATVTVENEATGRRFTYRLSAPYIDRETSMARDTDKIVFVGLMNGPDNDGDYAYMGAIRPVEHPYEVKTSRKSRVSDDAPSFKAIQWVLAHAREHRELPAGVNVWHEGKCGRCGRKLTVPESIARGIGPECAERMGL